MLELCKAFEEHLALEEKNKEELIELLEYAKKKVALLEFLEERHSKMIQEFFYVMKEHQKAHYEQNYAAHHSVDKWIIKNLGHFEKPMDVTEEDDATEDMTDLIPFNKAA